MPRKKLPSEKSVAVIFNLPPKVRNALNKKVKSGRRSRFVVELLAERLGVELEMKTPHRKQKGRKSAVVSSSQKKKSIFGKLFSK